ncbi:MAG TPA: BLUF domain-containing protein [Candidatus Acidoferrales bacterium]|nr:BLUF domain-containing protein [Candidatus Acidoferrales bacterium]
MSWPRAAPITPGSQLQGCSSTVTGMLLYKDGCFMQVLEGNEEAVIDLAEKIQRDPRHKNMMTLYQGDSPERQFAD